MTYLLEKSELHSIKLFTGLHTPFLKNGNQEKLKNWNDLIFEKLLIAQPDLKKEYELFTSNISDIGSDFEIIFDKKIDLKNTSHFIFKNSHLYRGYPEYRSDFFIQIALKEPEFSKMIHNSVKENNGTDFYLFYAYFKLLKDSNFKKMFPPNDILENIKNFYTGLTLKNEKIKIRAYLNLPRDESLYDFIMLDMKETFIKSPLLADYFKTKLIYFTKEIRQDFSEKMLDVSPFQESEEITYNFNLDKNWTSSKFNITLSMAQNFNNTFHNCLTNKLYSNFKSIQISQLNNGLNIKCDSLEQRKEIKEFCHRLCQQIIPLFKELNLKDNWFSIDNQITKIIDVFNISDNLSIKLPLKRDNNATTKIKI